MSLALVFRPNLFGQRGSFIFYYQIPRVTRGAKAAEKGAATAVIESPREVELQMVELTKGSNFIEPEIWKLVEAHGDNAKTISDMVAKGALASYAPDSGELHNDTTDWSNVGVAAAIVQECYDEDWLTRSMYREQRKHVISAVQEQLKQIKENKLARSQSNNPLGI